MNTLCQRARIAGLDPNHWYVVSASKALRRGAVIEVWFWGRTIALFRTSDGLLGAVENRCLHRSIKLSLGTVCGDRLVCAYHGWEYDAKGCVVRIPHDLFGHSNPRLQGRSFPVSERYGYVWLFPGEHERADLTPLPTIPELDDPRPWLSVRLDFSWRAHFSMILENLLDFTHAHLHRKYRPFADAVLTRPYADSAKVGGEYNISMAAEELTGLFVNRPLVDTSRMKSWFEYPYQRASTHDKIKQWCFLTPSSARSTRLFLLIMFDKDTLRIPFTSRPLPLQCARFFLNISRHLMIAPILKQDGRALEAEQDAFERYSEAPLIELNPVVRALQEMLVSRWEAYEARVNSAKREDPLVQLN